MKKITKDKEKDLKGDKIKDIQKKKLVILKKKLLKTKLGSRWYVPSMQRILNINWARKIEKTSEASVMVSEAGTRFMTCRRPVDTAS